MKQLFLILSITIFISCGSEHKNHLSELKIQGNVKSIKETHYWAEDKFGDLVKGNIMYDYRKPKPSEFQLNLVKGNIIRNYQVSKPSEFQFNEVGNITEQVFHDKYGVKDTIKFSYKEDKLVKKSMFHAYRKSNKLIREYNANGQVISETSLSKNDEIEEKWIYEYDDLNLKTKELTYGKNGKLKHELTFFYDSEKNLSKSKYIHDKHPLLNGYTIYKYDQYGNVSCEISLSISEKDSSKKFFEYDNFGNIKKQTKYKVNGKLYSESVFEYEFDEKQNWVKRRHFHSIFTKTKHFREYFITERQIEYYQ